MTVGQVGLAVRDLDRAVGFYRDCVGLRLIFRAPNAAFFDGGSLRLMLTVGDAANSLVYFRVDEIDDSIQTLKSRGVVFDREAHLVAKMPDHELWMAFFHDPDGNPLGLMCEKPRMIHVDA
jgi:methylmalonyl-CoA/ethylmalonyl-CoA epimerase